MGAISEVATTVAESAVPSKKLRIKILAKKPVNEACEISQAAVMSSFKKQPLVDDRTKALTTERKLESNPGTKSGTSCLMKSSFSKKRMMPVIGNTKSDSVSGSIHSSEVVLEGPERKRLKMDCMEKLNCITILTKLMKNKLGAPFCTPVNPDAWGGIDDYFDIIKNPMDLGTIHKKLLKKAYTRVEEFEADVRLTFSNAMLYNPPNNWVHKSAKELDMMFTNMWKLDKMRMNGNHKSIKHQVELKQRGLVSRHDKITHDMKSKPDGEHKNIKQQVDIKQRGPGKLTSNGKDKCSVSLSSQVCQLSRKTMPKKQSSSEALKKVSVEGQQHSDLNVVKPQDGKLQEHVSFKKLDSTFSSTTGVLGATTQGLETMDVKVSPSKALHVKPHDGKLQEHVSFEKINSTFSSTTGFLGATTEGLETMDVEVSPSKALRVAKLKSRFADTILKAQHKRLLETGGETKAANWLQEKLILERKQREEKERIEAQIRAVQSAARLKAESELKQEREAARKASRLALEKMKRSVDLEDNLRVLRDLEAMVGGSLVVMCQGRKSHSTGWSQIESKNLSPLQRLGLYIKKEYMVGDDDDDDDDDDVEEGEVV